jgi:hypothetical protein
VAANGVVGPSASKEAFKQNPKASCAACVRPSMHASVIVSMRFYSPASALLRLGGDGGLEAQLQAAVPDWQREFCGTERPLGSPSLLLVSPAAARANALIKSLQAFNSVRAPFWIGTDLI